MPVRGIATALLVACAAGAGIWGVDAFQAEGNHRIEILLCLLVVAVAAGAAVIASAIDEQTIDDGKS